MELYLVRHGQTVWNKAGKLQGRTDIELNENGREAARELGRALENVDFDKIYSSPLIRAYETACLIRGHRNIPIIRDERLLEISFGDGEGDLWESWNRPENPYSAFFNDTGNYVPPPHGETFEHVMERTKNFIQSVIEPQFNTSKRIMIVAHGALDSAIICYLEGNSKENFWGKGLLKNCQAVVFEFDGKNWRRK